MNFTQAPTLSQQTLKRMLDLVIFPKNATHYAPYENYTRFSRKHRTHDMNLAKLNYVKNRTIVNEKEIYQFLVRRYVDMYSERHRLQRVGD